VVDGACGTNGRNKKCVGLQSLKERDNMKDLSMDGGTNLKLIVEVFNMCFLFLQYENHSFNAVQFFVVTIIRKTQRKV
jgi:hypothetical protein